MAKEKNSHEARKVRALKREKVNKNVNYYDLIDDSYDDEEEFDEEEDF